MGTFRTCTPPTSDPRKLGPIIEEINQKLFGNRFKVIRLGKENLQLGHKARWAFYIDEEWTDVFFVVSLTKKNLVEIKIPAWAWDEVEKFRRSFSQYRIQKNNKNAIKHRK